MYICKAVFILYALKTGIVVKLRNCERSHDLLYTSKGILDTSTCNMEIFVS